jgi:hypothetical protein
MLRQRARYFGPNQVFEGRAKRDDEPIEDQKVRKHLVRVERSETASLRPSSLGFLVSHLALFLVLTSFAPSLRWCEAHSLVLCPFRPSSLGFLVSHLAWFGCLASLEPRFVGAKHTHWAKKVQRSEDGRTKQKVRGIRVAQERSLVRSEAVLQTMKAYIISYTVRPPRTAGKQAVRTVALPPNIALCYMAIQVDLKGRTGLATEPEFGHRTLIDKLRSVRVVFYAPLVPGLHERRNKAP